MGWKSISWKLLLLCLGILSCQNKNPKSSFEPAEGCSALTGTPWLPAHADASARHHDSSVEISKTVIHFDIPLSGAGDSPAEATVEIPMPSDLGSSGSMMLVAESLGLPSGLKGGAFPVLTSLYDGKNELIHLKRSLTSEEGANLECPTPEGLFCCVESSCKSNPAWSIQYPSVYHDRDQWEQHQINPFGYLSVSIFPTCNWSSGVPSCLFNDKSYFEKPELRFGQPYQAKYALIMENYANRPLLADSQKGKVKLTVIRKKAEKIRSGTMDLNIILVGSKNVSESRNPKGKQNLDALISHVQRRFNLGGSGLKIGTIQVFEWDCRNGGDAYADVSIENLGALFSLGSSMLPSENETRAINFFLVSNLQGARSGMTILGASGAVGGPLLNRTAASGLAFASFNKLDQFNPQCGSTNCPVERQERQFVEMGETMAHELGHFFGLNHLSEANGRRHDGLPDTPKCTRTEVLRSGSYITHRSCRRGDGEDVFPLSERSCLEACPAYDGKNEFCPDAVECAFNHLMWWTSKNFNSGKGDGSLISEDSWSVIHFSPAIQ